MRGKLTWGLVGLVMLGACAGDTPQSADSAAAPVAGDSVKLKPKTVTVNVSIMCGASDSTFIKVNPWVANLKKNNKDSLSFVLDANSNAQNVTVALKTDTSQWPVEDTLPLRVGKGSGKVRGLKGAQAKDSARYPYNITATCVSGSKTRKLVIDPDIFVD